MKAGLSDAAGVQYTDVWFAQRNLPSSHRSQQYGTISHDRSLRLKLARLPDGIQWLTGEIPIVTERSLYTRLGDIFVVGCGMSCPCRRVWSPDPKEDSSLKVAEMPPLPSGINRGWERHRVRAEPD